MKTKMKFLMLFVAVLAIGLTSCNKEAEQGEVAFEFTDDTEKSFEKDGTNNCDLDPSYLLVVVDGIEYKLPIFSLGGILTTQVIKLDVGTHIVSEFVVMNDNGTPNDYSDDVDPVFAAVHENGDFSDLVSETLHATFEVEAFTKTVRSIPVICYIPASYASYGFEWFTINPIIIRERCFFEDLCIICPDDYIGSAYEDQANGVQFDVPAILSVDVFKNGVFVKTYTNEDWLGEGAPLCVPYADELNVPENFEFAISTLLPVADGFDYVYQYSVFSLDDEETVLEESVIGNCYFGDDVLTLPYHVNLPVTVDFILDGLANPSQSGAYFDATVTAPIGYTWLPGEETWCLQPDVTISTGITHTAQVFTSMDPITAAATIDLTEAQIKKLHWLVNHAGDYGYDMNALFSGQGAALQNIIWHIAFGTTLTITAQIDIAADVDAGYLNYNPIPNEDVAFVIFLHVNGQTQLQLQQLDYCL